VLKDILQCLVELKEEVTTTNRLMITFNTGIRKNTLAVDELAASLRARDRAERERGED
jgi:hypothetical protein